MHISLFFKLNFQYWSIYLIIENELEECPLFQMKIKLLHVIYHYNKIQVFELWLYVEDILYGEEANEQVLCWINKKQELIQLKHHNYNTSPVYANCDVCPPATDYTGKNIRKKEYRMTVNCLVKKLT